MRRKWTPFFSVDLLLMSLWDRSTNYPSTDKWGSRKLSIFKHKKVKESNSPWVVSRKEAAWVEPARGLRKWTLWQVISEKTRPRLVFCPTGTSWNLTRVCACVCVWVREIFQHHFSSCHCGLTFTSADRIWLNMNIFKHTLILPGNIERWFYRYQPDVKAGEGHTLNYLRSLCSEQQGGKKVICVFPTHQLKGGGVCFVLMSQLLVRDWFVFDGKRNL